MTPLWMCHGTTMNECHHKKGLIDSGTTKNAVFCYVKSGKCTLDTPQKFANYADEKIIGVTTLYMLKEKMFNQFSEFSKLATYGRPFQKQYYRRYGDLGVCSHGKKHFNEIIS